MCGVRWLSGSGSREKGAIPRVHSWALYWKPEWERNLHCIPLLWMYTWHQMSFLAHLPLSQGLKHVTLWITHPQVKQREDPSCVPVLCFALLCLAHTFLSSCPTIVSLCCKLTSLLFISYDRNMLTSGPLHWLPVWYSTLFQLSKPPSLITVTPLLNAFFSTLSQLATQPHLLMSSLIFFLAHTSDVLCLIFLSVFTWQNISYLRAECLYLYHVPHLTPKTPTSENWKDGSAVKNACCFCRVPGFGSQHPNQTAHKPPVIAVPWDLTPLLIPKSTFTHITYKQAHTHSCKIN